jgi:hypothetical protein
LASLSDAQLPHPFSQEIPPYSGLPNCVIPETINSIHLQKIEEYLYKYLKEDIKGTITTAENFPGGARIYNNCVIRVEEQLKQCGITLLSVKGSIITLSIHGNVEVDLCPFCRYGWQYEDHWRFNALQVIEVRYDAVCNEEVVIEMFDWPIPIRYQSLSEKLLEYYYRMLGNENDYKVETLGYYDSYELQAYEAYAWRFFESEWRCLLGNISTELYCRLDACLFAYPFVERLRATLRVNEPCCDWIAYENQEFFITFIEQFREKFPAQKDSLTLPGRYGVFFSPFFISFSLFHQKLTLDYEDFRLKIREYPHIQGESIKEIMTMLYAELRLN